MTETTEEPPNTKDAPPPPMKRRKVLQDQCISNTIHRPKMLDIPQNGNSNEFSTSNKDCVHSSVNSERADKEHSTHQAVNSSDLSRLDPPTTSPYPSPPPMNNPIVVIRGPQTTEGLDEVRPPRRPEKCEKRASHTISDDYEYPSKYATADLPVENDRSVSHHPPTGLSSDVDVILTRIFDSGLFERKDIDGRALDFLGSVSPQLAIAALDDIQRRDFSTVRNKPAFIMSIFKRVVAGGGTAPPPPLPPPGAPYVRTSVPASALAHLPPAVSNGLQRVFTSGVCHPSQFDDRAMDILVDLQEPDAVRALSEFAAMEPGRVRNPSAFWMGLARKYKGHSCAPGGRMGPAYDTMPSGSRGSGYGGFETAVGYDVRRVGNAGGCNVGAGGGGSASLLDQRLDELSSSGHLPRSALDDRAVEALRRLPEQEALGVLAELPEPARVRNMSAYVMGLCKKFASGEARSLSQRSGVYGGSGGSSGGGGYSNGSSGYGGTYIGGYGNGASYGGHYAPAPSVPGGYTSGYGSATANAYGSNTYAVNPTTGAGSYGVPPMLHADHVRNREVREALDGMDPAVRERFYQMTEQGIITETSFDARAIGALQSMRREEACAALDELAASELGRILNISSYFMGLAKKFRRPSM